MPNRAARQSAEQWSEIITEFQGSSLSVEAFCRRKGFAISTFNRWRNRFSRTTAHADHSIPARRISGFVEAVGAQDMTVVIAVGDAVRLECPVSMGLESIARLALAVGDNEH